MKIGIIGTGYVGLPTGVGLAHKGHEVCCIDIDEQKVHALSRGEITLYEDGLEELMHAGIASGRLRFTTSMCEGVAHADVVMVAVGTPPHPKTREADMQYIYAAVRQLAVHLSGYTVVAIKSTVPVGTGDEAEAIISSLKPADAQVDVVSLPEFLREGYAVHDFFHPERIVIGTDSLRARAVLHELYSSLVEKDKMLDVSRRSSEMIKYASNSFLAIKIHYINEMANLCERCGADITDVARGMGSDSRIGNRFLQAGPGYGGSCFPKDTQAMVHIARKYGVDLTLIRTTIEGNARRSKDMAERLLHAADQQTPRVAALGLSFKNGTDDCRESPAMDIIGHLLAAGARITAYDPKAMSSARRLLGDSICYAENMYAALEGADVLAILTEWEDFKSLDLAKAAHLMRHKRIVDCRNMLDAAAAEAAGFAYQRIGK